MTHMIDLAQDSILILTPHSPTLFCVSREVLWALHKITLRITTNGHVCVRVKYSIPSAPDSAETEPSTITLHGLYSYLGLQRKSDNSGERELNTCLYTAARRIDLVSFRNIHSVCLSLSPLRRHWKHLCCSLPFSLGSWVQSILVVVTVPG